jgi:hypothetical protein
MIECETLKVVPVAYQHLINAAKYNENMSDCKRRHVGCAIGTINGLLVGAGYNGDHARNPMGTRHTCTADAVGKCGCMHAEIRAITTISKSVDGYFWAPQIVAVTAAPCLSCTQALLSLGAHNGDIGTVETVLFWEESLPGEEGVSELLNYGVRVFRVPAPV